MGAQAVSATTGIIKVTICIRLNEDVDAETAREFVDEMECEIRDTTGLVSIAETEVIDGDIGVDGEDGDD
jgi:hypothetical protein